MVYILLSFNSQIAIAARPKAAIALGQTGIRIPAATTSTPKIKRNNWAMAIRRNKTAANNDAGLFMYSSLKKLLFFDSLRQ